MTLPKLSAGFGGVDIRAMFDNDEVVIRGPGPIGALLFVVGEVNIIMMSFKRGLYGFGKLNIIAYYE